MASPIALPLAPALDTNANPLAGALMDVFVSGTTTPATAYQNSTLTTPHANPIVASSDGKFPTIYLSPSVNYRFRVRNSAGVAITGYDFDPVSSPATRFDLFAETGAALIGKDGGGNVQEHIDAITGTAGGDTVGALSLDGSTATTIQRHIVRNYVEDFGVTEGSGGNAALNTAALNAILAAGEITLNFRPGALYRFAGGIAVGSGHRLVCERGTKPTIYMPAANFTNTTPKSYGSTSLLFDVKGELSGSYTPASNVLFENLIIQSEVSDGRYLRGIAARNVNNFNANGIEIFGFPTGIGITLGTVNGDSGIRECYIHDFYTNTAWGSTDAQMTGIEIDNDRYNGMASEGLKILSPWIDNLVFGPTAIAAVNDQTDGINIVHYTSKYHTISDARISRVAEGIDHFGSYCTINNPVISQVRYAGLKLFHGASYNVYNGPVVKDAKQYCMMIGGSYSSGIPNTTGNVINGGTLTGLNYTNTATGTVAGVFITNNDNPTLVSRPTYNTFRGTLIDEGPYGPRAWYDESTLGNNFGESLAIIGGAANVKRIGIPSGGGRVSLAGAASTYYTDLT